MATPRYSILLPTLEAERDLERLLPVLARQRGAEDCEWIAIDSDSHDCTRQLLRAAGFQVECIERVRFRHGETRNQLARRARGELCVFLSQDALPVGEGFLEELARPLADPRVAGSTARVLPHREDDPLTARTVLAAPEAAAQSAVHELGGKERAWPADGEARLSLLRFNNVASCIRRQLLLEHPFPDVPFGEDVAWAAAVLSLGWRTVFAAGAVVEHAHVYRPRQAFERYRVDAAFHRRVHGHRVRPSLYAVARGLAYELREDYRYLRREGRTLLHLLRAPPLRAAQVLGQYCGSRGWNPRLGAGGATADYA